MIGDRDRNPSGSGSAARVPPHNADVEAALLGAAMLASSAAEIVATQLAPEAFYLPAHSHIAGAVGRAWRAGAPADPVTLADDLARRGLLDRCGGLQGLLDIQTATPSTSAAAGYAATVRDYATLRAVLGGAGELIETVYSGTTATAAIATANTLLGGFTNGNGNGTYSTLEIADIAAILGGNLEPEDPHLLVRNDGRRLLYAGKLHFLQGEPTSGKSWIALAACLEVIAFGGAAVYVDFEDAARSIVNRLLALGADPAILDRFHYIRPHGAIGAPERLEIDRLLDGANPDLVIIDGVAEALAREGLNEDRAGEVVGWIDRLPRPIARTGAAVVLLDHVAKDREQQGRWARGTGAKLAAVDGATYITKVVAPFSRYRAGEIKLVIAKDRPGGVGTLGETAAVIRIAPHAAGAHLTLTIEADTGDTAADQPWKPTGYMRRVSEELARAAGPLTATEVRALIYTKKPRHVSEAIARLIAEGYVAEVGRGRSKTLRLVRPYHDADALEAGDEPATEAPPDNVIQFTRPGDPGDPNPF